MARGKKAAPEPRLAMAVNGITLVGERRDGRWRWACPAYPDLAETHAGRPDPDGMVAEFMARALAKGRDVAPPAPTS